MPSECQRSFRKSTDAHKRRFRKLLLCISQENPWNQAASSILTWQLSLQLSTSFRHQGAKETQNQTPEFIFTSMFCPALETGGCVMPSNSPFYPAHVWQTAQLQRCGEQRSWWIKPPAFHLLKIFSLSVSANGYILAISNRATKYEQQILHLHAIRRPQYIQGFPALSLWSYPRPISNGYPGGSYAT